jgi:hypothetical protein
MRQTVGFHATSFDCEPVVEYEVAEGEEIEPGTEPAALLVFRGGPNVLLHVPISVTDAEGMMGAFTQAEPMRQSLPSEATTWQPEGVGLPAGMFWLMTPQLVGMSVTPPQQMPDGLVPHWTLAFQDADDSQVQVAVSDALCVQIVRALAQVAHGEFGDARAVERSDDDDHEGHDH